MKLRTCTLSVLFFTTLLVSITACSYQETCPAFGDNQFDLWFPYKENQILYFKSGTGTVDSIKISRASRTSEYQITKKFLNPAHCSTSAIIASDLTFNPSLSLEIQVEKNPDSDSYYFITAATGYISANKLTDTGAVVFGQYHTYTRYSDQQIINGITYSKVQEVNMDTLHYLHFQASKIWIAKNKGVIGFQRRQSGEIFSLLP